MCLRLLAGMACEALVDLNRDQFVDDRVELDKRTAAERVGLPVAADA
jgi:hypothetical protein